MITSSTEHRGAPWISSVVIVTAGALVRLVIAASLPLFPDEAYYWAWSRHLAAGYFDHPPAVALLIRLGTGMLAPFGAAVSPMAVRLGPVIAGWVGTLATIGIARRLCGRAATGGGREALRAAVIITAMPLAAAGLVLATPDSPVLAATAVGLYCVVRALDSSPGSRASLVWWLLAGATLGLAFSSKYTSIFLPVGVALAIVLRRELRPRLRESGPYLACGVAVLVFAPVLLWNAQHGWISFVFQLRHGLASAPARASGLDFASAAWRHEGDLIGGQAGLASPILFVLLIIATARSLRRRSQPIEFVLGVVAVISFGFFVYSALYQRVEPNWPAPAYIPAIVLLATTRFGPGGERWLTAGVALAVAMAAVIYVQALEPVLPLRPDKDPIARAFGWRDVAAAADSTARSAAAETRATTWLGGDRYQEASELAFYDADHPETFATNLSGRTNQYDLWPRFPDRARAGDNLVLVLDDSREKPAAVSALATYFAAARRGVLVVLRRAGAEARGPIGTRRLWILLGWRGGWPATVATAALGGQLFRPYAAHERAIDRRAAGPMSGPHGL